MELPALLLGAGSSVPAGGLTLEQLRLVFERAIEVHYAASQMKSVYDWTCQVLETRIGYEPDFELVLSAFEDIRDYYFEERVEVPEYVQDRDGEVVEISRDIWIPIRSTLHYFFEKPREPLVTNYTDEGWGFIQTIEDLRSLFKQCVTAMVHRIEPARSPLTFIAELAKIGSRINLPLDVFTLNYDILVEQTLEGQAVPLTTGGTRSGSLHYHLAIAMDCVLSSYLVERETLAACPDSPR